MRLLLLTSNLPWPLELHGGAQRTALLLEVLRQIADVDIAYVSWSEESVSQLQKIHEVENSIVGKFFVRAPSPSQTSHFVRLPMIGRTLETIHGYLNHYAHDAQFSGWLREVAGAYDGVVSRFLWPGSVGNVAGLRGLRKLLDWDDLDHLKIRSQIAAAPWKGLGGAVATPLLLARMKKFCLTQSASYDHVWVAKSDDIAPSGAKSVSVLPNIPFNLEIGDPDGVKDQSILFIGNQNYLPNSGALTTFIEDVWIRIRQSYPKVRLLAIGPPPPPAVEASWRATAGVEVIGVVPSLAPYYSRATLSICPVVWGGGSNIKVIESLGYGVPCVVSAYSFAAFRHDFGPETGLICAESVDEMVSACVGLLTNAAHSAAIGTAGRKIVETRYSRDQFSRVVALGLAQAGLSDKDQPL